jgi:hypothetical protein
MGCLVLYTDQLVKQKQYDLLREVEHRRLVRVIARSRSKHLQKVAAALRRAMVGLTRDLPRLRPVKWKVSSENTRR